jgi:hypothetical protein
MITILVMVALVVVGALIGAEMDRDPAQPPPGGTGQHPASSAHQWH